MSSTTLSSTLVVGLIVVVAILAGGGFLVIQQAENSRTQLQVLGELPQFEMIERSEEPVGREIFEGKISVVDFFFTTCHGPCPTMSTHMSELYRVFKPSENVQFVSITVNPDYDTPEVMQAYARDYGVTDNRWLFLWDEIEGVVELCENGFKLAAEDLPGAHSTKFVLVDDQARIRGYYDGTDPASMRILQGHISQLAGVEN